MFELAFSFDDVLLTPQHSTVASRADVSIATHVAGIGLSLPILSANMKTVTETDMAVAMYGAGGLGVIHRMMPLDDQCSMIASALTKDALVGFSFGVGSDWEKNVYEAASMGVNLAVLDIAHADQERVIELLRSWYSKNWIERIDLPLVVGNIATPKAADNILECVPLERRHRFALKVGIGGGSLCTTRMVTGSGWPTFQSVYSIHQAFPQACLIADGGIRNSGDIVKALAAGASAVMCGSLLAGTKESPGNVVLGPNGNKYKIYRGSASYGDKVERGEAASYVEGTETFVPYKGSVVDVLKTLKDGICSGLSYSGARTIEELQRKAFFVRVTEHGQRESQPHGLTLA